MTRQLDFRLLFFIPLVVAAMWLSTHRTVGDALVFTKAMSASTIAEVFVDDGQVRIEMEIGGTDILAFRNLLPDEIFSKLETRPVSLADRLNIFFEQDLVIKAGANNLPGSVAQFTARRRVKRDEITGKPMSVQPAEAKPVFFVELVYKFSGEPTAISIAPPTNNENNYPAANIGFITYHRNLPVSEFRYLSQPETLHLDWQDPWFSRFENPNLKRQFDAPISTFLYIEPFEVRKEIVIRPLDLQKWVDLGIQGKSVIPIADQAALKQRVAEFLETKNPVKIDGKPAVGKLDRIHFIRRTLRNTGVVYPEQDLSTTSATLGVITVYPITELPNEVSLTWELFGEKFRTVPASATDEAGGMPSMLTAEEPAIVWRNHLLHPTIPAMIDIQPPPVEQAISLPWLSIASVLLICVFAVRLWTRPGLDRGAKRRAKAIPLVLMLVGIAAWPGVRINLKDPLAVAPKISETEANQITHSLLHNLYHSFDRREESLVYDQLATSLSGDLLQDIYLQTRRSIELENQGGAQVKIDQVEIQSTENADLDDRIGYRTRCQWIASGTVGHWGHIHRRANRYVAEFNIEPMDNVWKITSLQFLDETPLSSQGIDP